KSNVIPDTVPLTIRLFTVVVPEDLFKVTSPSDIILPRVDVPLTVKSPPTDPSPVAVNPSPKVNSPVTLPVVEEKSLRLACPLTTRLLVTSKLSHVVLLRLVLPLTCKSPPTVTPCAVVTELGEISS